MNEDLAAFITELDARPRCTDAESAEYDWQHAIVPRLAAAGWEARFRVRIAAWNRPAQQKTYEAACERLKGVGAIVALLGHRGCGKTFISAQIAVNRTIAWWNWVACDSKPAPGIPRYFKLTDVLSTLKPLYADFGCREPELLEAKRHDLCRHDLIVLDEIHECEDQKLKNRILTDILDRRYAARLDSLLISNETEQSFKRPEMDSVTSRIKEHGAIMVCKWQPWR